jgi:hypothetical protein
LLSHSGPVGRLRFASLLGWGGGVEVSSGVLFSSAFGCWMGRASDDVDFVLGHPKRTDVRQARMSGLVGRNTKES